MWTSNSTAYSFYWSIIEKEPIRDDKIRIDAENKLINKQKKKRELP